MVVDWTDALQPGMIVVVERWDFSKNDLAFEREKIAAINNSVLTGVSGWHYELPSGHQFGGNVQARPPKILHAQAEPEIEALPWRKTPAEHALEEHGITPPGREDWVAGDIILVTYLTCADGKTGPEARELDVIKRTTKTEIHCESGTIYGRKLGYRLWKLSSGKRMQERASAFSPRLMCLANGEERATLPYRKEPDA